MLTVSHMSVVLVSPSPIEVHSIRPETLRQNNILPSDWAIASELASPVFAVVQYQNGVSIQIEGNRCTFQEAVQGPLPDDYKIQPVVRQYLESTRLVPYNAIGINWRLNVTLDNPGEWIKEQLGQVQAFSDFSPVSVQVSKPVGIDTAVCNLIFGIQGRTLLVDCNHHFQLGGSVQPMLVLHHWSQCQQSVKDIIVKLPG
jgi:hypothetical protein